MLVAVKEWHLYMLISHVCIICYSSEAARICVKYANSKGLISSIICNLSASIEDASALHQMFLRLFFDDLDRTWWLTSQLCEEIVPYFWLPFNLSHSATTTFFSSFIDHRFRHSPSQQIRYLTTFTYILLERLNGCYKYVPYFDISLSYLAPSHFLTSSLGKISF